MLIEWVKALVPVVVAVIPVLAAIAKSARATRTDTALRINAVEAKLDKHILADEWNEMKQRRVRIIQFANEVSDGKNFSEEYWNDILEDIDSYELYCASHSEYHNNKGVLAMEFLKTEYLKGMKGVKDGKSKV